MDKSDYVVFYANKVLEELKGVPYRLYPDGTYIRHRSGQWYHIHSWQWVPMSQSELPPEMQAIALLYPFD